MNVTLTFDDYASQSLSASTPSSGTYKPTNLVGFWGVEILPNIDNNVPVSLTVFNEKQSKGILLFSITIQCTHNIKDGGSCMSMMMLTLMPGE
jgi:hypothetical protein